MKQLIKFSIIVVLFNISLASCVDVSITNTTIPDLPVHLELNLSTNYAIYRNSYNKCFPLFTKPLLATDYVGYGGVLVYTGFDGTYYAFDLSCPYEHRQDVLLKPNEIGQVVCPQCGSIFNIGYGLGNPESGKTKEFLKRYRTSLYYDILFITN